MNIHSHDYRVREGEKIDLTHWPTAVKPLYTSKKQYEKYFHDHIEGLSTLQRLLYALQPLCVAAEF